MKKNYQFFIKPYKNIKNAHFLKVKYSAMRKSYVCIVYSLKKNAYSRQFQLHLFVIRTGILASIKLLTLQAVMRTLEKL